MLKSTKDRRLKIVRTIVMQLSVSWVTRVSLEQWRIYRLEAGIARSPDAITCIGVINEQAKHGMTMVSTYVLLFNTVL